MSCKNDKEERFKHDIIGEWKFVKQIDSVHHDYNGDIEEVTFLMSDFICYKKGNYFGKNGFWDKKEGNNSVKYCGWDSKYKIYGDSLRVFVPVTKGWRSVKIHTLKGDTLVYDMGNKKYCLFERQHYKLNNEEQYDAIVVSSSGCYGTCPRSTVYVSNKGEVFFEGRANTTVLGSFTANIGIKGYNRLQDEFKKAGKPADYEEGDCIDAQLIVVSFIKDGKTVKKVSDCTTYMPTAFNAAYNHVLYLYQTVKLTKLEKPSPELEEFRFNPAPKFKPMGN